MNGKANKLQQLFLPGLLTALISSLLFLAATPPISRDALIHHLQIPKLYLLHGGIYEIPDLVFSYYPMNLDFLYMIPLAMGNDIIPKYIHMAFGLATAWLLFTHLKKRLPDPFPLLGAIFFLSTPIIVKLAITVYVDLGLIFFCTASMLLLFNWLEKEKGVLNVILAGLCCGMGVGTKYNGLLILFLLTLFIPLLVIRKKKNFPDASFPPIRTALIFAGCGLLAASPWLIRNGLWTGNPLYPLYDGFFNPKPIIETAIEGKSTIRGVLATRQALYGENLWQLLLLPVRIFFEGHDGNPRFFDGRLNPFLLILPILAFLKSPTSTQQMRLERNCLFWFCLLYFLFAFNTSVLRIRYLSPMVPFLVILGMYGMHNLHETTRRRRKERRLSPHHVLVLTGFLMLSYNIHYITQQFISIAPFTYLGDKLNRNEYLDRHLQEFSILQMINNKSPHDSKILCIFMGQRGYYLERDHVFDNQRNPDWLISWLSTPNITAKEVAYRLDEKGISHILIRTDLFNQWANQSMPEASRNALTSLFQEKLTATSDSHGYALFEIKK